MPPPQGTPNFLEGPGDYTVTETVHNDAYAGIDPAQFDLKGKAVFISGASKGVGRSTAISFAKAGASKIAIGARSSLADAEAAVKQAARDAKRDPPVVLAVKLDVTDADSVKNAAAAIEDSFGRLDILINNAAMFGAIKPIADTDPDDWWNVWIANVRGPYLVARACLPLMLKSDEGLKTFITVSSVGANLCKPGVSAYQSSKLAALRVTEFIAGDYASQGVIAITIHPGNMLTDFVGRGEGYPEEIKRLFTETTELSADSMVWLTAQRREWLNARYVNCTWDLPELEKKRDAIVKGDKLKMKLDVDF